MATKRQRGSTFTFIIKRAGLLARPYQFTTDDEREGERIAKRIEAALDVGVVPAEVAAAVEGRDVETLRAAVGRYMAAVAVSRDDKRLLPIILSRLPAKLGTTDLTFKWAQDFVTALKREQNLAPATVRHHCGSLARALDWIAADGSIPANPMRSLRKGYAQYSDEDARAVRVSEGAVKVSEPRDRRLEGDEESRIRRVLAGEHRAKGSRGFDKSKTGALALLFDMALESAMRMREMYTLEVKQVDLAARTIFLDKTKNGTKRQVPITTPLAKLLKAHLATAKGRLLFPELWCGERDEATLYRTTRDLSRLWARVFATAECPDLHFHDLRHEATSRIYERTTLTDLEVMKITGHKGMAQLARYANLRASKLSSKLW